MRAVITGASGFLGRAALQHLQEQKIDAIGVSRNSAANGCITVSDYAKSPGGDILVHLAEPSSRSQVAEIGYRHVAEVQRRLSALLDGRYKRVIYASSAVVYRDSDKSLRVGDPVHGDDPYSIGKLACESLILRAGGIVLRFSNIYGPTMKRETVFGTILSQIPGSGPLVLRDPTPVRDFLWIGDAANAISAALKLRGPAILNVGCGKGTSVGEVAEMLLELAGQSDRNVKAAGPLSETASKLVLDIAETLKKTKWRPRTQLQDGLRCLLDRADSHCGRA